MAEILIEGLQGEYQQIDLCHEIDNINLNEGDVCKKCGSGHLGHDGGEDGSGSWRKKGESSVLISSMIFEVFQSNHSDHVQQARHI